jgi:hypothetical protein
MPDLCPNHIQNVSKVRSMSETPKVAVTVAEMARMCGLGRSRFYQLIGTALPYPLYCVSTKRPFYDQELQQVCLEVRRRNCGIDGRPILFYAKPINRKPSAKKNVIAPKQQLHPDLLDSLRALGLIVTSTQIDFALKAVFPNGVQGIDQNEIVRRVFIYMKKNGESS